MGITTRHGRGSKRFRERERIIQDTLRRVPLAQPIYGGGTVGGTSPPPNRLPSLVLPSGVPAPQLTSYVPGPPGNPGAPGAPGAAGAQGSAGLGVPGFDGKPGRESIVPGPPGPAVAGPQGIQGIQGPQGWMGPPGMDIRTVWREPLVIPGPRGDIGLTGTQGIPGIQGSALIGLDWGQRILTLDPWVPMREGLNAGRFDSFAFCGASIASQVINAATTAYLTDSACLVGRGRLRLRHVFKWVIKVSKSAAGLNTSSIFLVKIGTAGAVGDATVLTFTLPATQTAVVDDAVITIIVTVRGPIGAACVVQGFFELTHNLAATGFATIPVVVLKATSAGFNSAVDSLIAGIACTTAAATVLTFEQVVAEMLAPAA